MRVRFGGVGFGFGALIGLRSAGVTDVHDVVHLQAVLMLGVWEVIACGRSPDSRLFTRTLEPVDRYFPIVALPLHLIIAVILILIVLGVWGRVDDALYVTALAAGVVFAHCVRAVP